MPRFYIRPARETDNEPLCALSKVPIQGQIALALERYPDYFAAANLQNQAVELNLCCDGARGDRIVAVFSTGRRREFVDGAAGWVRYLSDVRILPEYQGGRPLRMINNCIIEHERSEPSAAMQSVMFSDNDAMRGVIRRRPTSVVKRLNYLWFYDLGTFRTSTVSLSGKRRPHAYRHEVRRATLDDVSIMQEFFDREAPRKQFYPQYQFHRLGEPYFAGLTIDDYFLAFDGAQLVGITGMWDQQAFKQTRIAGYGLALRWSRPMVNVVSRLATGFSLPPAGTELRYFYLHTMLTRENSVAVFRDLVEHIYAAYHRGNYAYFMCGLFAHDPLLEVLDSFRSRRDITAQHYQVGINELDHPLSPDMPMYLEVARI